MVFSIAFNEEKNQLLKATRGIGFDEIIRAIEAGNLVADLIHPSKQRPNQRLYAVRIVDYIYAVPYVLDPKEQEIFLKTAFPSRTLTKQYIKGGEHAKYARQPTGTSGARR